MAVERTAYHLFLPSDWSTEAEIKARFSAFTVLIVNPAIEASKFIKLREWLPNTYILAAEVNAMRVPIPADGSEPPWSYGQEIKATFPSASLWRNCCTGAYVTDGNPQSVNYSLSDAVVAWWKERVRRFVNISHGIYSDDSAAEIPAWLLSDWGNLGLIDNDGDGFPSATWSLNNIYVGSIGLLTAALRGGHPGPLIANTGTARVDGNLNGISLELSGISAEVAAEAFKAQLRVARRPRLCVAWAKTQEEVDEWRAVQQADPGLREVIIGQESGGIEIVPGSKR